MKKCILLILLSLTTTFAAISNEAQKLPTIQEAWVDSVFFDWVDSSKTALLITKKRT